ncbi:cd7 antigen-like [Gymnodraco acuticeps]|uniref:Cd7 antigen-like n=1 Tax=Gymnodraco acuticeps TaxID=8218 RepID=A0A6P8U2C7_GYMAC|nr:cd7 antigen-like [Gymnodraco acuticeps]
MKTSLACILIFIQLFEASAELILQQLMESQSLELSCSPQLGAGRLTGLHLYHHSAHSQTTLLSLAVGGELRVAPGHRGRLQLLGGLESPQVNVTVSQLQRSDTGLYLWELSYTEDSRLDQILLSAHQVFLLVEGTGRSCQCSPSYPPLLFTIFTVAGLLLLTISWLAVDKCVKARYHHRPQPPVPIYEEMTRKQQSAENNPETPSQREEADYPVYANPNIRQPQDNYYACPRQLALRA